VTRRERVLLRVLGGVVAAVVLGVAAIQVFGRRIGEPCPDSYACRGFLVGGSECVAVEGRAYCTRYCKRDDQCPRGWRCLDANPTVLTVQTRAVGRVCVR
jgi:hypothetical protein